MNKDNQSRQHKADSHEPAHGIADKTHETAESLKNAAVQRVEAARQDADAARGRAAEQVRKLGSAVRKIGEHLRVENQHYIAGQAARASDQIEVIADYIGTAELRTVLRDTETLARRNPGVFFGSAFALGLAAGRFLKSASSGADGQPEAQGELAAARSERPARSPIRAEMPRGGGGR